MMATILILCEHFGQIRGSISYTFCISLAQLCLEALFDAVSVLPSGDCSCFTSSAVLDL